MIARQDISRGGALREVAAILAAGYERLLAQTSAEANPYHDLPSLSEQPFPEFRLHTESQLQPNKNVRRYTPG